MQIFNRALLIVLLSTICSFQVFGQKLLFKHISQRQGLSQSAVHDVVQDAAGFIWLATEDGLNRYDGLKITVFKDDPAQVVKPGTTGKITDRSIQCLFVQSNGTLWIGTSSGGLNAYSHVHNHFIRYPSDSTGKSVIGGSIYDIQEAGKDKLWLATNAGLELFDISTGKSVQVLQPIEDGLVPEVRCLLVEKNVVWAGTHGQGIIRYEADRKTQKVFLPTAEDGSPVSRYAGRVRSVARDNRGNLWMGTDGSYLFRVDEKTAEFISYQTVEGDIHSIAGKRITTMHTDSEGILWIGTDAGLCRYDVAEDRFDVYRNDEDDEASLKQDYVLSVSEDAAGSLWVGTSGGGVSVMHRTLGKFNHFKHQKHSDFCLPGNTVFALEEDKMGNIWVGTIGEGLTRIDFNTRTTQNYQVEQNKTHNKILCIKRTRVGVLWFGTWGGGLNSIYPASEKFGEPVVADGPEGLINNTVLDIEEDAKGNLWIATFKGLCYYHLKEDSINAITTETELKDLKGKPVYLPVGHINSLYMDRQNNVLWIGMEGGGVGKLQVKRDGNYVFESWNEDSGLSSNSVFYIEPSVDGDGIWAATKSGLNFIDSDGRITVWYEQQGLQSDYIVAILTDPEGYLWLSTNKGLTRFKPGTKNKDGKDYIRNYTEDDGLQGSEFNQGAVCKTESGELFFGGINGLNHFYARQIKDNPHVPPVVITSFKVLGKEYALDSAASVKRYIELSWRQNFFSFDFAALDFVLPEKNLYQYKMENYDEDWSVPSTRPFASYTGLPGGDYVFLVRAANNDGIWSEPLRIYIRVNPPFWKTTAFYVLVSVSVVLILFLLYRWRISKMKREKRVLEEKVTERTRELAHRTEELAEKNKDIMDSIHYAKRIQKAILPETRLMHQGLPEHFVLYLPKDVVSGDFYWFGTRSGWNIVAAVDCTGHGVPGAFMSMIGSNLLSQIVNELGIYEPGKILEALNLGVQKALKQGTESQETNDGMDVSLVAVNTERTRLMYAGAYRPLILIRNQEITKTDGNKYPIGGSHVELNRAFETHTFEVQPGDVFYMSSDGYADQFGGPKGKKFMGKRFNDLLLSIYEKPMTEQYEILHREIKEWSGDHEQNDDICVIGLRI
jgi:ligand-binding sensor domain-containing protein/serine phosphatase RsbU (regulator of sigma subunit)